MMALDFFSTSSSESAAFGGLIGGRVASRFTTGEGEENLSITHLNSLELPKKGGEHTVHISLSSVPLPAFLSLPGSRPRSSVRLAALRSPSGWEGRSLLRSSTSLLKLRLVAGVLARSSRSPRSPPRSFRSSRSPRSPAFSPRSRLKLLLEEIHCFSPVLAQAFVGQLLGIILGNKDMSKQYKRNLYALTTKTQSQYSVRTTPPPKMLTSVQHACYLCSL